MRFLPWSTHITSQITPLALSSRSRIPLTVILNLIFILHYYYLSRFCAQHGARRGAWSHDPEIKTWAKIDSRTHHQLNRPRAPSLFYIKLNFNYSFHFWNFYLVIWKTSLLFNHIIKLLFQNHFKHSHSMMDNSTSYITQCNTCSIWSLRGFYAAVCHSQL